MAKSCAAGPPHHQVGNLSGYMRHKGSHPAGRASVLQFARRVERRPLARFRASPTVPGSLGCMANRLANETSPYLLQHKDNPVDWFPWGEEALARAREEDRPILLSIGYSACHWCHVMERESFEDPETAALMNERFVVHQARPRGAA